MNTRNIAICLLALLCHGRLASSLFAESVPALSQTQRLLAAAAAEDKYTFLVFYKDKTPAVQAMATTVKSNVDSRRDRATFALVNAGGAAEKELVDRFGISRAPMPLTIAVAPNGAMTKLVPGKITDEQIEESFVTPAMAKCMKSMQEGRLVLVCIQSGKNPAIPAGVKAFSQDEEFKTRVAIVAVRADDDAEKQFVRELESDVAVKGVTTVFFAPPSVLVGKFSATATKEQLATALHNAGHCCDDPNCKHNHAAQESPPQSGKGSSRKTNQNSSGMR